jgi:hypothetical protein
MACLEVSKAEGIFTMSHLVYYTVIRTVELMGRFHDSRVINIFYNGFLSKPYIGFLYVLLLVHTWQ